MFKKVFKKGDIVRVHIPLVGPWKGLYQIIRIMEGYGTMFALITPTEDNQYIRKGTYKEIPLNRLKKVKVLEYMKYKNDKFNNKR